MVRSGAELVNAVVKLYEELLSPGSIVDKYNSLVDEYRKLLSARVRISIPMLGQLKIKPRKFKKFVPLPLPHCIEDAWEFDRVHFGDKICLVGGAGGVGYRDSCYPNEISFEGLMEVVCNIGDILESAKADIGAAVSELPKIIDTIKTIIAEGKLLS
jgi:hypothetical protein